jgi:hypothetical protein
VLLGIAAACLLGTVPLGLGQRPLVWMTAAFLLTGCIPILNGSNQAIWQAKVAPDVQGRVFAVRRMIGQITFPFTVLVAGPLADFVFEPAMQPSGVLAGWLGWLFGSGTGAGIGLMLTCIGLLGAAFALSGYLVRPVRAAEDMLPDHRGAAQHMPT